MLISIIDVLLVCIVLAAFAFGLRTGIAVLIIIRPLTDRLFELASFDVTVNFITHHVTYGVVINLLLICTAIVNAARIQRCTPAGLRSVWLPFLLICAAAVLYSPQQFDATRRVLIYASYFSIFGLSFVIVNSERDVALFLKLVILSSVLPVLYGLFATFSGLDWSEESRIQSTFSHPNMFAFYLVAVIGIIFFLLATERIRITDQLRLLLYLYLIPLLVVLIMTKTRSAWIGCFVLFFGYGVVYDRRVLALLLIAAPVAFAIPAVNERIMSLMMANDYIGGPAVVLNSFAWRQLLWERAFAYIWQQPIFGYGLHSFPFYSAEFFYPTPEGTYAHNDYIQVLFETGLVGLIAFLWIFSRCSIWVLQRWRADKGGVTAAAALMLAYLTCSFSDNLLEYLPYQWEFWFAFGVICRHLELHRVRARSSESYKGFANGSRFAATRRLPGASSVMRTPGSHSAFELLRGPTKF